MSHRKDKLAALIKIAAAEFLEREASRSSLITVTDCVLSSDMSHATIYVAIFPDDKEKTAMEFAKRKRAEMREYLKEKIKAGSLPFLDIKLDEGEKHRQRIDALLDK